MKRWKYNRFPSWSTSCSWSAHVSLEISCLMKICASCSGFQIKITRFQLSQEVFLGKYAARGKPLWSGTLVFYREGRAAPRNNSLIRSQLQLIKIYGNTRGTAPRAFDFVTVEKLAKASEISRSRPSQHCLLPRARVCKKLMSKIAVTA